MTRVGAFFDVDKTILAENSAALYLRALYELAEMLSFAGGAELVPKLDAALIDEVLFEVESLAEKAQIALAQGKAKST